MTSRNKTTNSWIKVGVTAAILLGSAAIVGSGAFAVWTSSATANAAVNAGAIKISLADSNIVASGMAPGDTIQELLPITFAQATNSGDLVSAINFSVAASNQVVGVNPSDANTAGANDGTGSSLFTGSVAAPATTNSDGSAFAAVAAGSSALTFSINTCSVQWVKIAPATSYPALEPPRAPLPAAARSTRSSTPPRSPSPLPSSVRPARPSLHRTVMSTSSR